MKKIFIISLVLLLISLISWGTYVMIMKSKLPNTNNTSSDDKKPSSKKETHFDTNSKPALFNISEIDVVAAGMSLDGNLIRYVTNDGKAMLMTTRGTNQKELFNTEFNHIKNAFWSPNNNDLILYSSSDGLATYSTEEKKVFKLKSTIDNAIWSNINNKILYKHFNSETKKRSINISKESGANWREIVSIPFRHISFVQIPNSSDVAFWKTGDSFYQSKLQRINIISPNKPTLIHEGLYGADYLYNPNGDTILVGSVRTKGGSDITIGIMNNRGGEYENLKIPTLISKTVWSRDGKTIYYAQPTNIPPDSIMPNDYRNEKFKTRDTFWKIDTETGKKSRLIDLKDLTEKIDATNLFLSKNEESLFFINKVNSLLYRLKLTP